MNAKEVSPVGTPSHAAVVCNVCHSWTAEEQAEHLKVHQRSLLVGGCCSWNKNTFSQGRISLNNIPYKNNAGLTLQSGLCSVVFILKNAFFFLFIIILEQSWLQRNTKGKKVKELWLATERTKVIRNHLLSHNTAFHGNWANGIIICYSTSGNV